MLILTLKENEKILIGDQVSIMVVDIRGQQVRLGIKAPPDLAVLREGVIDISKGRRRIKPG
jgi:carbon storage regulator